MFFCPGCRRPPSPCDRNTHDISPRFSKPNIKFHKCFKDAPSSEIAFDSFSCALVADLLLQGHLFISENWFCFYSKILGREKQIEIPVRKVRSITRKKTAFFIPNAIKVTTEDGKYLFGSLISRDAAYKLMVFVWKNSGGAAVNGDNNDSDENSVDISPEALQDPDTRPTFNLNGDNISTDMSQMSEEGSEVHSMTDLSPDVKSAGRGFVEKSISSTQTKDETDLNIDVRWWGQIPHQVKNCFGFGYNGERVLSFKSPYLKTPAVISICTVLVIILLISAMILSYKILSLEAKLASDAFLMQNEQHVGLYDDIYRLNEKLQTANIRHLHSAIEAHMAALKQMQESLKSISSVWSSQAPCINKHIHDET